MCDYSGKLVAWLDRELGDDQMLEVQHHARECLECRTQLAKYERVSTTFDAYCDAVLAAKVRRQPRWVPLLSVSAALVLATTLALTFLLRTRVQPLVPFPAVVAAPSAVVFEARPLAGRTAVNHQRNRAAVRPQTAHRLSPEPSIQVAIPAESMFPPGAVPEGVNFTAEVTFGPDGSAQQIRLRPSLIGFERRVIQP
jgi:anti-sigma factor RsiW